MTRWDAYVQNRHLSLDRKEFLTAVQFVRIQIIYNITYVKNKKNNHMLLCILCGGFYMPFCDTTFSPFNFWYSFLFPPILLFITCCSHWNPKYSFIPPKILKSKEVIVLQWRIFPREYVSAGCELTSYSLGKESTIIMSYTKGRIR